jgi:imidazole glycerol-phosphate synthase subunit HisH
MRGPVIIDYGAGNLRSVAKALEKLGAMPTVTSRPEEVESADLLVLPGVGAAADTMGSLERLGLVEPVRRYVASGRPFFGVCLGLQVLLDGSEEGGWQDCLGLVPGVVKRLPRPASVDTGPILKVPHMGWNQVWQRVAHPIFAGVPDGAYFYFVHSYFADPKDSSSVAGETEYGVTFPSVLARENVVATQFHPEKSGDWGLKLYANFLAWGRDRGAS